MTMLPFRGSLWDMDGTLVDTEPYWMRAETELMRAHGLHWDEQLGELMVGNPLLTSAQILREHGLDLLAGEIVDRLLARVVEQVRGHVPFRPGARELLAELRAAGLPCALVTMSYRVLAEAVVAACPEGTFAALVTGDEVEHGKPHPEPYLAGASALGLDPAECLAFEDSLPGLRSALAAGTQAVAIPHIVELPTLPGARYLPSLAGVTVAELAALGADALSGPRSR
ncbi:HAD family hydrolase [Brevibacterium album]|uniref:HAD family hydrolase n=1 Tax=Brevibacterium album TaxID=417948 RepID=UPI000552C120|nr:HAD family phosphatase [Brevibacterium album]